jgi:predicted MFS family arabinose efflux permease
MPEFIVARAIAGIGGGGMTTVVNIIMSDIIPLRERGTWQGVVNMIYATGASIGAPLGGVLSDTIGWRWAFMGQFPVCLLACVSVFFALKLPKQPSSHWKQKIRRVDAVTTLLVGLDQGSNTSWQSPVTIVCLAVSAPLFALFVFVEQKIANEPFAPGRIIFERSLFASYLCNFFSFGGWYGVLFYVPLYFQAVKGLNATQAGVKLLPGIICGVTGSLSGGFIMQKTGRYYWLTVAGYTLLTLAGIPILLSTGLATHSTIGVFVGLGMGGLGNGSGVTTSLIALISNAAPVDQAIVTACSYLFRSLGSAIGLSVQSALFQASLRKNLEARLSDNADAAEIARKVRESLGNIRDLSPALQVKVRAAYQDSITNVLALVLVIVSGAMFASCEFFHLDFWR